MADSFIAMDEESIKHISHDCAFVDLPNLTPEEQKSCVFFYGSKEFDLIAAKKVLPQSILKLNFIFGKDMVTVARSLKILEPTLRFCEMKY